jgi:hypothetical protein
LFAHPSLFLILLPFPFKPNNNFINFSIIFCCIYLKLYDTAWFFDFRLVELYRSGCFLFELTFVCPLILDTLYAVIHYKISILFIHVSS